MSDEKTALIERLAKGNAVELEKVRTVQQQLAELERAGLVPHGECLVERPLGRIAQPVSNRTLANAAPARSFH